MTSPRLILASGSTARRKLLANAGLSFEVIPAAIEEPLPDDAPPGEVAIALSLAKAHHVAAREDGIVIGSDQVLVMPDGSMAGKPWALEDARTQLTALQGRTHTLISAAAIVCGAREEVVVQQVMLTMRALSDAQVNRALAWNEWQGNAGSFAFESRGIHLMADVDGDLFTILGLPLLALLPSLRSFGVEIL